MTSHFAAITLTDFLAKAQLLDRNVNFMSLISQWSERCVLHVYGLIR